MRRTSVLGICLGLFFFAAEANAQSGLADYDYENLAFRGFSIEGGYIWPNRTEPTYTIGTRVDLGYLGPGLRLIPGVTYWSSDMKDEEVRRFEQNIDDLVNDPYEPIPDFTGVDLGRIEYSDFIVSMDAHFVWSIPLDVLTFLGAGLSLHIIDGDGEAIDGTFVEDLIDSVKPGFNIHGGLEYPLSDAFRVYGEGRYEIMEDLRYFEARFGLQVMLTGPAAGEEKTR